MSHPILFSTFFFLPLTIMSFRSKAFTFFTFIQKSLPNISLSLKIFGYPSVSIDILQGYRNSQMSKCLR